MKKGERYLLNLKGPLEYLLFQSRSLPGELSLKYSFQNRPQQTKTGSAQEVILSQTSKAFFLKTVSLGEHPVSELNV